MPQIRMVAGRIMAPGMSVTPNPGGGVTLRALGDPQKQRHAAVKQRRRAQNKRARTARKRNRG